MVPRIAIVLIATGAQYRAYASNLIPQLRRHFTGFEKYVFLFSDVAECDRADEVVVIEHLPMPLPSLLRYHWMDRLADRLAEFTHLYYLDVDLEILRPIGEEVLAPVIAVRHWGWPLVEHSQNASFERRPHSSAYVPPEQSKIYVQASLQGGEIHRYMPIVRLLRDRINCDLNQGIGQGGMIAVWWDESHWNWWVNQNLSQVRVLPPEYAQGDPGWSSASEVLRPAIISHVPKDQLQSWKWRVDA